MLPALQWMACLNGQRDEWQTFPRLPYQLLLPAGCCTLQPMAPSLAPLQTAHDMSTLWVVLAGRHLGSSVLYADDTLCGNIARQWGVRGPDQYAPTSGDGS